MAASIPLLHRAPSNKSAKEAACKIGVSPDVIRCVWLGASIGVYNRVRHSAFCLHSVNARRGRPHSDLHEGGACRARAADSAEQMARSAFYDSLEGRECRVHARRTTRGARGGARKRRKIRFILF